MLIDREDDIRIGVTVTVVQEKVGRGMETVRKRLAVTWR